MSLCSLGEDVVATGSSRLSNPQDVLGNENCKLKNKKGKVLMEDKRGKGLRSTIQRGKSKVDNSTTFALLRVNFVYVEIVITTNYFDFRCENSCHPSLYLPQNTTE